MKSFILARQSTLFSAEAIQRALWGSNGDERYFVLYLLLYTAFEMGHTLIRRGDKSTLYPSYCDLVPLLSKELHEYFQEQLIAIEPERIPIGHRRLLIETQGYFALKEAYEVEHQIVNELRRIRPINEVMPQLPEGLNREQEEAIRCFFQHAISIITGGPGTGKTYTAGKLVQAYIQSFFAKANRLVAKKRVRAPKIILAAPTGKAVRQLEKSVSRYVGEKSLEGLSIGDQAACLPILESSTIHALISKYSKSDGAVLYIDADLIIIDEASMIDVRKMQELLERIPSYGTRLLFLGDHWQLPPVGSGAPFEDLCFEGAGVGCGVAHLTTSVRVESHALLQIAQAVREGNSTLLGEVVLLEPLCQKRIVEKVQASTGVPLIVTPSKYGPYGVRALNNLLEPICPIKRIMITENDWELGIANGEIGEIVYKDSYGKKRPFIVLGERLVPLGMIKSYEEAFAITIHKSQGSESEEVFCVLPESESMITRKLLYTAVTRAKKHLTIFSTKELVATALERYMKTETVLKQLLREIR
jgi:exodeoxyribonuclease V alpha subunit